MRDPQAVVDIRRHPFGLPVVRGNVVAQLTLAARRMVLFIAWHAQSTRRLLPCRTSLRLTAPGRLTDGFCRILMAELLAVPGHRGGTHRPFRARGRILRNLPDPLGCPRRRRLCRLLAEPLGATVHRLS